MCIPSSVECHRMQRMRQVRKQLGAWPAFPAPCPLVGPLVRYRRGISGVLGDACGAWDPSAHAHAHAHAHTHRGYSTYHDCLALVVVVAGKVRQDVDGGGTCLLPTALTLQGLHHSGHNAQQGPLVHTAGGQHWSQDKVEGGGGYNQYRGKILGYDTGWRRPHTHTSAGAVGCGRTQRRQGGVSGRAQKTRTSLGCHSTQW